MKNKKFWDNQEIKKNAVEIIQVNLGNKCNQVCSHCHIQASPNGQNNMNHETAKKIIQKIKSIPVSNIEFTGGAPEMNLQLKYFIEELTKNKHLSVRTNLTILDMFQYKFYIDLYKKHKIKIIASLPGVYEDDVDQQRGKGIFKKSIKILQKLNQSGFGTNGCYLDLVYNPSGDFLPPKQEELEQEYKKQLKERYNITFNNLITIVNSPLKNFKNQLQSQKKLDHYLDLLHKQYNPATLSNIMCRSLLSVDYDGSVYDCDFNLAVDKKIKSYEKIKFWDIDFNHFNPEIFFDMHCYACTVNQGSSCHGSLVQDKEFNTKQVVQEYYGTTLQKTSDLKTNACCTADGPPDYIKQALSLIHDEIKMKYYGCGSPLPSEMRNLKILDVGCGTGRDCYIASYLVGQNGFVYGIDMTKDQIQVAEKHLPAQMKRFGYKKTNMKFVLDDIENINQHFTKESLDIIISNCVINLTEDKKIVLKKIFNILKYGGEFYFSDVYADRRASDEIQKHPVLYGECLGGALYKNDFERIAREAGFADPRIMSEREIKIISPKIKKLIKNVRFYSITYRLWKLQGLEDACEDYGHVAIYKGGLRESPYQFQLDNDHIFDKNKPERICGNTALMLQETRYKKYFKIIGSFNEHFGLFENCDTLVDNNCCR